MTSAVHEATAQMGAYVHEAPADHFRPVAAVMGAVAAGECDPEQGLRRVADQTRGSDCPFEAWQADYGDGDNVQRRIALQQAHDQHLDGPLQPYLSRWNRFTSRAAKGSLLGVGAMGTASYAVETDTGLIVAKLSPGRRSRRGRVVAAERRLSTLLAAKDDHFESALTLSYELGVVGTSFIPGPSLRRATAEQVAAITDDQLRQAAETIGSVSQDGVVFDFIGGNTGIDPETGVGFYDALRRSDNADRLQVEIVNAAGFVRELRRAGKELYDRRQRRAALAEGQQAVDRLLRVCDLYKTVVGLSLDKELNIQALMV